MKIPKGGSEPVHKELIKVQASRYINIIDAIAKAAEEATSVRRCVRLYNEMDKVHDEVVQGRKAGLAAEGESAAGNIVFKVLRRTGHLGMTNDVKRMLYDKIHNLGEK